MTLSTYWARKALVQYASKLKFFSNNPKTALPFVSKPSSASDSPDDTERSIKCLSVLTYKFTIKLM